MLCVVAISNVGHIADLGRRQMIGPFQAENEPFQSM